MALSFSCPSCATPFRVTEELAGKRVKCPKCLMVFSLPALAAEPATAATEPLSARRVAEPINDLFREPERREAVTDRGPSRRAERDEGRNEDRDRDLPRTRRSKAKRSGGSMLPWVLGLGAAAIVLFLVCGGGVTILGFVLFADGAKKGPPIVIKDGIVNGGGGGGGGGFVEQNVQLKQGPGKRVALVNGQFTTTTQLAFNDPVDPEDAQFRCKLYQIELQANRVYTIDMTTPNGKLFDPFLRLEDMNEVVLAKDDDGGGFPNARIRFVPAVTGPYVIVATCYQPNQFGNFTLTVRDTTGK